MRPFRIHGLPVHPVLVHFPVAGWSAATLLLAAAVLDSTGTFATAAWWCNAAALVTGLAAMVAGFVESGAVPEGSGTREQVARHMLLAGSTWTVYLIALIVQFKGMAMFALAVSAAGFVLLLFTGHAGARLVYPHGLPEHAGRPNG